MHGYSTHPRVALGQIKMESHCGHWPQSWQSKVKSPSWSNQWRHFADWASLYTYGVRSQNAIADIYFSGHQRPICTNVIYHAVLWTTDWSLLLWKPSSNIVSCINNQTNIYRLVRGPFRVQIEPVQSKYGNDSIVDGGLPSSSGEGRIGYWCQRSGQRLVNY